MFTASHQNRSSQWQLAHKIRCRSVHFGRERKMALASLASAPAIPHYKLIIIAMTLPHQYSARISRQKDGKPPSHSMLLLCATTLFHGGPSVVRLISSVGDWPNAPHLGIEHIFIAEKLMAFYWHTLIHDVKSYMDCVRAAQVWHGRIADMGICLQRCWCLHAINAK